MKAFYKCQNCLGVTVVDQESRRQDYTLRCALCNRKNRKAMFFMGVRACVEDRLSKEYTSGVCDEKIIFGFVYGKWTFVKRGANYGLVWLSDV